MNKKIFFLFFLISSITFSQSISKKEGISFAKQLYKKEVLSRKGKKELISKIKSQNKNCKTAGCLEKRDVLLFLLDAFYTDYSYRNGVSEFEKIREEVREEIHKLNIESGIEKYELFTELFIEKRNEYLEKAKIAKIENAIENLEENRQTAFVDVEESKLFKDYKMQLISPKSIHKKRSVLGKHYTKTLEDLLELELIDEREFQLVKSKMYMIEERIELGLIVLTLLADDYYSKVDLKQKEQNIFLHDLYKLDLIEKKTLDSLQAMKTYQELSVFDEYKILKPKKFLRKHKLPKKVEEAFPVVLAEFKELIPELEYEDLQIALEKKPNPNYKDFEFIIAKISLTSKGEKYEIETKQEVLTSNSKFFRFSFEYGFYELVNKVLEAQNFDVRLVKSDLLTSESYYVVMNEKQRCFWEKRKRKSIKINL
ncbi:hypothetical protein [Aureivirga sp. CE67]|uniref:hypothetical protein n=1 Tax=Aureivirga sp. CE67 TaxID=1788983 RepID=UPI0018CA3D84|nr:hypothetical protein [Aureivirga sp. CE67]